MNLMLEKLDHFENKIIILGSDFNLFLDSALEIEGGSPVLKRSSVSKLIETKEKYNLCDIWRIKNTKEKNASHFDKNTAQVFYEEDHFFASDSLLVGVN